MSLATGLLPTSRKSPLLFQWEAKDLSLLARTGQPGTLTRGSDSGIASYADSAGSIGYAGRNAARWALIGGAWSLLLEGSRINADSFSEQLDNAGWTKTRSSITSDATTAPDGNATADKLVEDATATNSHIVYRAPSSTPTDNTLQTFSVFAKAAERTWIRVRIDGKDGNIRGTYFNLATGAIGSSVGATGRIVASRSGWYRCIVTADSSSGVSNGVGVIALATGDGGTVYSGDGTSGAYVWGAQFEVDKPFASSYIPTGSAGAITRAADSFAFACGISPEPLTFYAKFGAQAVTASVTPEGIFGIGTVSGALARWNLYADGATGYATSFANGAGGPRTSSLAMPIIPGDQHELRAVLTPSGTVYLGASVNVGAESLSVPTTALSFPGAWSNPILYLGNLDASSYPLFASLQSIRIAAGEQTMDYLRSFS